MSDEVSASIEDIGEARPASGDDSDRERSLIGFPYMSLGDAIEVANAIHATTGSGPCQYDQLAAALRQQPSSSTFRVKVSTARIFGLIDVLRGTGTVKLTPLGEEIVDQALERKARATAFLSVPLYKVVYEQYRGKPLPPPVALERELARLGVSSKQTDRARQALMRSAEQAGFFEMGPGRLVLPAVQRAAEQGNGGEPEKKQSVRAGGGDGGDNGQDPLIGALIRKLPPAGTAWPVEERIMWLRMAAMAFQMAYTGSDQSIEIRIEKPPTPTGPATS